jgi:hypothetical protein
VTWLGPAQVTISRHKAARIFLAAPAVGVIRVDHSAFDN